MRSLDSLAGAAYVLKDHAMRLVLLWTKEAIGRPCWRTNTRREAHCSNAYQFPQKFPLQHLRARTKELFGQKCRRAPGGCGPEVDNHRSTQGPVVLCAFADHD